MMNDGPFQLSEARKQVQGLSDRELLQIVQGSARGYSEEVLDAARAEIAYRRLAIDLATAETRPLESAGHEGGGEVGAAAQVRYQAFRGRLTTWDDLFGQAAAFATQIGRENVLSISHSEDDNEGVVTVWYWT